MRQSSQDRQASQLRFQFSAELPLKCIEFKERQVEARGRTIDLLRSQIVEYEELQKEQMRQRIQEVQLKNQPLPPVYHRQELIEMSRSPIVLPIEVDDSPTRDVNDPFSESIVTVNHNMSFVAQFMEQGARICSVLVGDVNGY